MKYPLQPDQKLLKRAYMRRAPNTWEKFAQVFDDHLLLTAVPGSYSYWAWFYTNREIASFSIPPAAPVEFMDL
jgi:hypothetical protein